MTKDDAVDRDLAVMRAAIAPPSAAKQRVRKALVRAGSVPGPLRARWRGRAIWNALGLVGAGALGGYWIGVHAASPGDSRAPAVATQSMDDGDAVSAARPPEAKAAREHAPAPIISADAGAASAPPEQEAAAAANDRRKAPRTERHGASDRPAGARAKVDPGTSELLLLRRAERAIRAGEGALALALVAELDQRHPRPRFAEERVATRVMARCSLREAAARTQAEAFLEAHPLSVYSDRVRKLCGLERPDTAAGGEPPRSDGLSKPEH